MGVVTLHEVEGTLRTGDPSPLREITHQTAHSHIALCGLTSKKGDCAHISEEATQDRIDARKVDPLAAMLAPSHWTALWLEERL
jgi:hypothetical protein